MQGANLYIDRFAPCTGRTLPSLFNKHVDIEYMGYLEMIKRSPVWRNHHFIYREYIKIMVYYTCTIPSNFFYCSSFAANTEN